MAREEALSSASVDYDTLTLVMEKRIAAHVKIARKKRARNEEKEAAFFSAAAVEALFVWMSLANQMSSDLYHADKSRLTRMIEDVAPLPLERWLP